MTEVTEEARAELDAINDVLAFEFGSNLAGDYANAIMLALDKHHGRTPPDPMVAKAVDLLTDCFGMKVRHTPQDDAFVNRLADKLKRMFLDG